MAPKKRTGLDNGASEHHDNQVCEKVIQMILSLQVPAHEVMAAVNLMTRKMGMETRKIRGRLAMNQDQSIIGEQQSQVCQFVYSYLLHNI